MTLANSKLWLGRVPAWALDTWKELNSDLLSANEDWGIWTSWYEQRLRADTTTQDTEIARVTIDDRIWGSGVKALNAHLKELLTSAEFLKTHWPMTWKIRHKLTQFPNRQLPRAGLHLQSTRKDASISLPIPHPPMGRSVNFIRRCATIRPLMTLACDDTGERSCSN